ncbi:MAG: hypothetical protein D6812_01005 [Deltaproteobacteria bacterium]|nr:MAG: hypothetical protein D6812_01005 [Deltaproteobacteria bacterium]
MFLLLLLVSPAYGEAPRFEEVGGGAIVVEDLPRLTFPVAPDRVNRLLIEGTIRCLDRRGLPLDDGRVFDLLSTLDRGKPLFSFDPPLPAPEVVGPHRYRFTIPSGFSARRLTLRIDYPALVQDRLVGTGFRPTSEVKECIARGMRLSYRLEAERPPVTPFPWLGVGLPATLLLLGTGWIIRRRRQLGRDPDIAAILERIRRKEKALLTLIPQGDASFRGVREQVPRLRAASLTLASELRSLRRRIEAVDAISLERTIETLEKERIAAGASPLDDDLDQTIAEKKKLRATLRDNEALARKLWLRLERAETVLETLRLEVPRMKEESSALDDAFRSLDEEVSLLDETLGEVKRLTT